MFRQREKERWKNVHFIIVLLFFNKYIYIMGYKYKGGIIFYFNIYQLTILLIHYWEGATTSVVVVDGFCFFIFFLSSFLSSVGGCVLSIFGKYIPFSFFGCLGRMPSHRHFYHFMHLYSLGWLMGEDPLSPILSPGANVNDLEAPFFGEA